MARPGSTILGKKLKNVKLPRGAIVGAIVVSGRAEGTLQMVLGVAAIAMAMINVIGGFMVTDRMLGMFKKR